MNSESREFTFNVSSPAKLKLGNISGSVVIEPGDDGIIRVMAEKHSGRGDAETTKIECVQAEDGSVSIETRYSDPSSSFLFGEQVCDVDYVVKIPQICSLKINGVSNSLNVSNLEGDFNFKTVSGDVTMEALKGPLTIDSVSGDLSGTTLSGPSHLKSVSGDINLQNSDLISAYVNTVSGDVNLQTGLDKGPYKFNAVSGDIRLLVPSRSSCNVYMHSISGEFSTNLPVNKSNHSFGNHSAMVGTGGVDVLLNSVSGDLVLECDGDLLQPEEKNSLEILSKVESGELSVEDAIIELNR